MIITVKEFSKKHNIPEHIVILFLKRFGIEADRNTEVSEENVICLMKPLFEEFKRQNPIVGRMDPSDLFK